MGDGPDPQSACDALVAAALDRGASGQCDRGTRPQYASSDKWAVRLLPQELSGMQKMEFPSRTSGILLHPTSLPGPHGIGSLGPGSYRFVDFLVRAQQTVWQILPLSPPGFGNSPYSAFCSVAGNPLLVSLRQLMQVGDLEPCDTAGRPGRQPVLHRL